MHSLALSPSHRSRLLPPACSSKASPLSPSPANPATAATSPSVVPPTHRPKHRQLADRNVANPPNETSPTRRTKSSWAVPPSLIKGRPCSPPVPPNSTPRNSQPRHSSWSSLPMATSPTAAPTESSCAPSCLPAFPGASGGPRATTRRPLVLFHPSMQVRSELLGGSKKCKVGDGQRVGFRRR